MKLLSLISLPHEPFLEKWARLYRFRQTDAIMRAFAAKKKSLTLIDFGCGQDILYYKYLEHEHPALMSKLSYIGIDPLVRARKSSRLQIISKRFEQVRLHDRADVIVMFAVLEHVDDCAQLLAHALTLLKPGGMILATTPSPLSKPLLEFLSYGVGVISQREIDEHKRYPTYASIKRDLQQAQRRAKVQTTYDHNYFELGLNNFIRITKTS